ncbi:MAG: UDP-N-acetylmuramate dehydrogenase [Bacillota bacterium]
MVEHQVLQEIAHLDGEIRVNEPMSRHTTWHIGGPADFLVMPRSVAALKTCLELAGRHQMPVTVIGNGSNVLVRDGGIRGMVIKTSLLTAMQLKGTTIKAEGGVPLPTLVQAAARAGLQGLEFAAGIPGTLGGALIMNAGAGQGSFSDVLREVTVMQGDGTIETLAPSQVSFGYRSSSLKKTGLIIVAAVLGLVSGSSEEIQGKIKALLQSRRAKQPLKWPNAGSVFANPAGYAAGYLIEQTGAKGLTRGRAQVSELHANFIINLGGATASDVEGLIEEVRRRVMEKYGIELQLEIQIFGE